MSDKPNKPKENKFINTTKIYAEKVSNLIIKISAIIYGKLKKIKFKRKPRVYMLRGYTTISRVEKKYNSEQNQRLLRNVLVGAIFALLISLLLILFNPFKDIKEIFRILGI